MRKRASRSRRPWPQRAERRKQSIFDFNHIDPHIQEEELEEIKKSFPILSQKILVPETSAIADSRK